MVEPNQVKRLSELLTAAARAHHDATGGPDHDWATWYAEFLQPEIEPWLGIDLDQLSNLLRMAAEKHPGEKVVQPWPTYYAELILDSLENEAKQAG